MIFKVADSCKGSLSLSSLKKIVKAGMAISIDANKIILPDVKAAIENKILIPVNEKEYKEKYQKTKSEVIIINMTKKIMVLGDTVLRPDASIVVDRSFLDLTDVVSAQKDGYIVVVTEKQNIQAAKTKQNKDKSINLTEELVKESPLRGEDRPVTPKTWDFREKKSVEAVLVPRSEEITTVDDSKVEEEVVIDLPKSKKRKEKKGKGTKTKKDNIIKPAGEQRPEKTAAEAQMDLDSRGQPIKKVGDVISEIVKSITGSDIEFVDKEQEIERLKNRNKI